MKYLVTIIALTMFGCGGKPCSELETKTTSSYVGTVNGCKVYDVHVGYKENSFKCTYDRYFMITDCRDVGLKYQCGKSSCNTESIK